ncbi:NAD(P)H-binding protein [Nonomuraea lactucae]|uniref:NAD(P)H-binding protein n=1 Tax=Nonomuraea lactucae TaxID=2249762 RepID=UPI000DE47B60|nr:NAD(P)H-binding protein [Nonomuraea lactucae]
MSAPILVTGATGTTGSRVVARLRRQGRDVRAVSRGTPGAGHFEWADPKGWPALLEGVEAVYLVAPTDGSDPVPPFAEFLAVARESGVRRGVLLSSSALPEVGAGPGALPRLVRDHLEEYAILRPSWFMTNVLGATPLAAGLRSGEVVTATGDGRVAFVDPDDIAAVAVVCLLADQTPGTDLVLTGPEALGYAEVCAMVSALLRRPIVHRSVDVGTYSRFLVEHGIPASYAPLLAALDEPISRGSEDRVTDGVQRITGRPPRSFRAFLQDHAAELAAG